jgi:hypothetical protein
LDIKKEIKMKYLNYDKTTGKILGWYDEAIHGTYVPEVPAVLNADGTIKTKAIPAYYDVSNIPTPNLKVSEKEWEKCINNNYNFVDVTNNTFGKKDFRTLDELKNSLKNILKSKIQSKIIGGFTFGSDTIKTDLIAQNNGNANYSLAVSAMSNAKKYATSTSYSSMDIILDGGVYFITFNGGTTGSTKPKFPTKFQVGVTDNKVTWYKFGLLVATKNGNKYFTPQEVEAMFIQFNLITTNLRKSYDEYKTKIEAVTSIKELDTLKTKIEGL